MKLCKDCRLSALVEDDKGKFYWRCERRTARFKPDPDYVTGKIVVEYQLPCRLARWDDMRCGREARYWEQRTDSSLRWLETCT